MTPATDVDEAPAALGPVSGRPLDVGTRLRDYEITGVVGAGATGIVYLAWDHSLQRKVAVKEYMPASMASRVAGSSAIVVKSARHADTFRAALKSFVNEARLLARFDHPSLVKVYRFWEENGTAYMVMPFYEGPTLKTALAELGHVPSEAELRAWLKPTLNAVTVLHEGQTWHQNIGPDEIVLTPVGPVLLGFGAATRATGAADAASPSGLKAGFAAIELYGSEAATRRGPWTDLYALAAVVYDAITGEPPPPAPDRLNDDALQPLGQVAAGLYGAAFLAAIDAALAVEPDRRPQDHGQFRALMGDIDAPAPVSLAPRADLMQELFLGDTGREVTVPDRPLPMRTEPAPPPAPKTAASPARAIAAPVPAAAPAPASKPVGSNAPSWMGAANAPAGSRRPALIAVAAAVVVVGVAGVVIALQSPAGPATATPPSAAPSAAAAVAPSTTASLAASMPVRPSATPVAASVAASVQPTAPTASSPSAPLTAGERQLRCLGILQKASLEQISAADTEFFKSQCK